MGDRDGCDDVACLKGRGLRPSENGSGADIEMAVIMWLAQLQG